MSLINRDGAAGREAERAEETEFVREVVRPAAEAEAP